MTKSLPKSERSTSRQSGAKGQGGVRVSTPGGEPALPLLIEPADGGADLTSWARGNRDLIEDWLGKHGGILFRNFPVESVEDFSKFVRAVAGRPLKYREYSVPRTEVLSGVYTTTDYPPDQPLFPHNESSYRRSWPLKIFFHCRTPAARGGETILADVRKVLKRIEPRVRGRFARKRWMYVRNFGALVGLPWQTVFQTTEKAAVNRYCRRNDMRAEWTRGDRLRVSAVREAVSRHPRTGERVWFNHAAAFHVDALGAEMRENLLSLFKDKSNLPLNSFYGDGSEIEPEVLRAIRDAYARESVKVDWQRGDVLLLDNMLVAHGRAPYEGERELFVAMAERHSPAKGL
jgi:alpha-ketoglutarate-dependent taurine dioxygenase